MEEDFQILFEYKKAQEANTNCLHSDCVERDGVYECTVCGVLLEKEPEPICMHTDDEVLHEGSYVCTGCGLVLTSEFRAEVNWTDRCIIARSYTPIDRLQAVDKHLITFFEKTGVNSPCIPSRRSCVSSKRSANTRALTTPFLCCAFWNTTSILKKNSTHFYPRAMLLGRGAIQL